MTKKLKKRAQALMPLRNLNTAPTDAMIAEAAEVYRLLYGKTVKCNGCNFYGFLTEIHRKLIREPFKITDMAKAHFKTEHEGVQVIRHTKSGTVLITSENLNEGDNLQFVAKEYGHLLAESKATAEATEEKSTAKSTSTKK